MDCFGGGFEGLWYDVEIVTRCYGVFDRLLGRGVRVCRSCICSWSSPCPLASCEYAIDHVHPVEEGVDDEHDWVQPDFVASKLGAEVDHEEPVEA